MTLLSYFNIRFCGVLNLAVVLEDIIRGHHPRGHGGGERSSHTGGRPRQVEIDAQVLAQGHEDEGPIPRSGGEPAQ